MAEHDLALETTLLNYHAFLLWTKFGLCIASFCSLFRDQCYPIEFSAMTETSFSVLTNRVATSQVYLLSTWNMANATEDLDF